MGSLNSSHGGREDSAESGSSHEIEFANRLTKARNGSDEQRLEILEPFRSYIENLAARTIQDDSQPELSVSVVAQSTIGDACKRLGICQAAGEEEFKAWLRQILIHDILSRQGNLNQPNSGVSDEMLFEGRHEEGERILVSAIEKLPADYQQVIRLRHQNKLTFAEIGKRMNLTGKAARVLWNRAVEELSKLL